MAGDAPELTPEEQDEIDQAFYESQLEAKQNGASLRKRPSNVDPVWMAKYDELYPLHPGKSIMYVAALVDKALEPRRMQWLTVPEITAPLPPIEWICHPLRIAPGAVTMFAGYGYSGKTAVAQSLVMSMVHARDVFGVWHAQKGLAAHADYEQGKRLTVERYQRLGRAMGIEDAWPGVGPDALRVVPLPEVYLDDPKAFDEYCWLCDGGVRMLLVDSFRAGVPSVDENDSKARIFLDMLARVSEKMGTACVVVHHFNKDGEKGGAQRLRGTGAIYDACQTVWSFVAVEGDPIIAVSILKDRLTGLKNERFGIEFVDVLEGDGLMVQHRETQQIRKHTALDRIREDMLIFIRDNPECSSRDLSGAITGKSASIYLVLRQELGKSLVNLGTDENMRLRIR